MSRFASSTKVGSRGRQADTINLAGGLAYSHTDKMALVTLLLSSFVTGQYYASAQDQIGRAIILVNKLVAGGQALFVARAAVYARRVFGMRTITHVIAAELAHRVKGERWTKEFYRDVCARPDDVTEILSYYIGKYGKTVPNSLKRGLGMALSGYDAYQLAKYRRENSAGMKLVDAVNICHPKHTLQLAALVNDTLAPANTWETGLTQAGSDKEAKQQVWQSLLGEGKLGYFALLRNLRNIWQQAPDMMGTARRQLTDEARISRSGVMPFRIYTALMQGGVDAPTIVALSGALDTSCANVPVFEGDTLVVIDRSGSMDHPLAQTSIKMSEAAALFGVALAKRDPDHVDLMIFGDRATYVSFNPADSLMSLTKYVGYHLNSHGRFNSSWDNVGHGTNFKAALQLANKPYQRIMYFSDMQGWVGYTAPEEDYRAYCRRFNVKPHIYSVDLAGHGTSQFPADNIYTLAGFSDKLLDIMPMLEQDRNALLGEIEGYWYNQ